jgi:hypothetical protein
MVFLGGWDTVEESGQPTTLAKIIGRGALVKGDRREMACPRLTWFTRPFCRWALNEQIGISRGMRFPADIAQEATEVTETKSEEMQLPVRQRLETTET